MVKGAPSVKTGKHGDKCRDPRIHERSEGPLSAIALTGEAQMSLARFAACILESHPMEPFELMFQVSITPGVANGGPRGA